MSEILEQYDALSKDERTAFDAWFNGAFQHVTQYADKPETVFMGKAECQWVGFQSFWLDKMVNELAWFTAEIEGTGTTRGRDPQTEFTKYRLWPTDLGFDVRDAELRRWRERVDANMESEDA